MHAMVGVLQPLVDRCVPLPYPHAFLSGATDRHTPPRAATRFTRSGWCDNACRGDARAGLKRAESLGDQEMPKTVIQHVLGRLKDIGIGDIFGVAGDFAFPVQDAIVQDPGINWIGCCNELNAGYAADGYARIRGFAALSTTYAVGELSAISAVGGSYAENVPVFHLTGMPATKAQHKRELVHHTLGNGEFDFFAKMAGPLVCPTAIITPPNALY